MRNLVVLNYEVGEGHVRSLCTAPLRFFEFTANRTLVLKQTKATCDSTKARRSGIKLEVLTKVAY